MDDTVAALDLIKRLDYRRFRRIQREVRYVANIEKIVMASYARPLRECEIDYARLRPVEDVEWTCWYYATLLVHEATHGAIMSHHVAYTKSFWARIERLCHLEAKRFARRADTADRQWSNALVGDFNEHDWDFSWHSTYRQRVVRGFARLREALHKRAE